MLEQLDDNTVEEIARIACGGEGYPVYRRGADLPKLLRQSGWQDVPDYRGEQRRAWLVEQLLSRRSEPGALDAVVCRLADNREYLARNEPLAAAEVAAKLNQILVFEGFEVAHHRGRPTVRPYRPEPETVPGEPGGTLHVAMTDLVSDPALAEVLQGRLDEARICDRNGAFASAIIMLGSLLEGVLLDAAMSRLPERERPAERDLVLSRLINLAHEHKWIQADVHGFADKLREYRNLVHPNAQIRKGHAPDRDTLNMCWPVINAALNDLAATSTAP
ncbi:hypothetical protein ACFFX1_17450 [Dactylosporangium sucinum]|uniref:DUF4145 domain-containing protein n=1 Tax=Dactylosporangium sucinum TaxID=1424081 RepID=A0A917UC93_9ACTN|nr:hypothetical protein [Dactylosporangium sucinum]GGM73102.1 hypothetical protein GCM10007977_088440 [Dactylosporangium sucinum]